MQLDSVFVQDGIEFFYHMRFHIACVIMEQKLPLSVEECLNWCTAEYFETIYALRVTDHYRSTTYEQILSLVKSKWTESEITFKAVFRGPPAAWDDDDIKLRIIGRDLYIFYIRD